MSVREFLPVSATANRRALPDLEVFNRAMKGRSDDPQCYLGDDWHFANIEAEARRSAKPSWLRTEEMTLAALGKLHG
jgi:hypothetical protein